MFFLTKKSRTLLCLSISLVLNYCLYAAVPVLRELIFISFVDALTLTTLITGSLFLILMPLFKVVDHYTYLLKTIIIFELPAITSKIIVDNLLKVTSHWYILIWLCISILLFNALILLLIALNIKNVNDVN